MKAKGVVNSEAINFYQQWIGSIVIGTSAVDFATIKYWNEHKCHTWRIGGCEFIVRTAGVYCLETSSVCGSLKLVKMQKNKSQVKHGLVTESQINIWLVNYGEERREEILVWMQQTKEVIEFQ